MSENNLLTIFEGSKIRLNYDGKNIQGKIMLSDGDSVEIEPFEISESELNYCWYGFSYKGKDFDMNVCLNDAENEGTPVCIYPVINGTTITTSDFAAIKKDSVFFEKQIAKEIINNNQMENKTMEFEKFKNYRNDFMIKNWNEKGQGNNSSFKKVGSLESIDSNNREQIIAVEKSFEHETGGTLGDDRAELVLKMANYDESSFKFLFDRENGNFVEYKNNEIVDVETPMGMLNYLHDEIQFQLESPLAKRADYFDEALFESMQDLYNKSNPFYTWDDLYILAEKETYLPAKDAAREQIGKAAKKFGIDIEASEIPEDAIADFLEKHPELNRFNESGQMLAEIDSENEIVNKPFIPSEYVLNKLQEKGIEVVTDKKEFERILESQAVLQKMATSLSDLKKLSASVKKQEEAISNEQEKSKELAEKESAINNHSFSLFVLEMQKYQDIFPNNEPVKITDLNYSEIPYYDFELFIEKDKNDQLRLLCNYKNRNNVGSVDNHSFYNLTNDSFDIIDPLSQFGFDMLKEVLEVSKAELSRKDYIPEIQEKLKDILESHQIKEKAILANLIEKNNERKNFVESRIDQISREEKRNAEKTLESWLNLADEMEDSLWNKDQLQVKKIFTENGTEERKPIAVISESDMQIFKGVKDRNLYADKSYIADHYINRHHNARTFLNIQNVLDNYDNIYFDKDQNSTGFTKRYGKMIDCVFMRVNEGKIILFGTTFEQPEYKIENGIKRGRFEKITPARKQEQNMSLEGSTPLSHNSIDNNEKAAVAISDVNDNSNISQPAEKSSNTLEDGSMFITQMKTEEIKANISVRTPSDIVPYLNDFSNSEVENFGVVLLDASYKVKEIRAVTVGTINRSIVHAREVFKEAVRNSAASVLIFHNHPSGNFEPSYEDINTTQKLMEASDIIGIPVLDHIIVSKEGYFSFEEHDMLNARTQNFIHDGTTYGFAHNGKIYLNSDVLSAEAAMHEYTHLWDNLTRKENPMLWNKGLEIFKGTSIWNEVINDEHYQDIKDDENLVLSECHARITGKVTETVLNRIAELDGNEKQAEMIEWDKETVEFIFENYRDIFEKNSFSSVAEFTTATMKDLFSPVEQQKQDIAIDSSAFERMEKFFEGKTSSLGNGDYQNFKELYDWVQEEFPSKDSEHVLLETVSRMIYSNINFGDLEPASYDDVYGFGDGAEQRFDVSDDIAKRLINNEITPDWMTIQNEVNDFARRKLMDLKENTPDMLVTDTINEAFEISKKYEPIAEKNLNAYTKSEKTQNIKKALENIKKTYTEDSHDIRIDYGTGIFGADLEALIKGNDAAIYGEKSLSFVRPDRASLELGIEDKIPFKDLIRGYGDDFVSESEGVKVPRHIERWDYMEVFDTDYDAAQQWKLETGGKLLENGKDIWISDENLEHFYYPDTPENRVALKEYLLPQPLEFNWDNFTEEQFNAVREEITSGNIKEDYKGQVYVGSVCVEFTITDKESCWVDYNNYILGEKGEGEISGIPYSYQNGKQVVMNTFTENTYENFKTVIEKVLTEDLGKDSHLKQEAMRKTINWSTINENNKEAALKLWKEKEDFTQASDIDIMQKVSEFGHFIKLDAGWLLQDELIGSYAKEIVKDQNNNFFVIDNEAEEDSPDEFPKPLTKDLLESLVTEVVDAIKERDDEKLDVSGKNFDVGFTNAYESLVNLQKELEKVRVTHSVTFPCGFTFPSDLKNEAEMDAYRESQIDKIKEKYGCNDNEIESEIFDIKDPKNASFNIHFSVPVPEEIRDNLEKVNEWIEGVENFVKKECGCTFINWQGGERNETVYDSIKEYEMEKERNEDFGNNSINRIKEQLEKSSGIKVDDTIADEIYFGYKDHDLSLYADIVYVSKTIFRAINDIDGKYTESLEIDDVLEQTLAWNEKELSELHSGTADDEMIKKIKNINDELEHIREQITYNIALTNLDFNNEEHVQKVKEMFGKDFDVSDDEAKVLLSYATHFGDGTHEYGLSKDGHLHFRTNQDNEGWSFITEDSMYSDFLTSAFDGATVLLDSDRTNDTALLKSFLNKNQALLNDFDNNKSYELSLSDFNSKLKELDEKNKSFIVTDSIKEYEMEKERNEDFANKNFTGDIDKIVIAKLPAEEYELDLELKDYLKSTLKVDKGIDFDWDDKQNYAFYDMNEPNSATFFVLRDKKDNSFCAIRLYNKAYEILDRNIPFYKAQLNAVSRAELESNIENHDGKAEYIVHDVEKWRKTEADRYYGECLEKLYKIPVEPKISQLLDTPELLAEKMNANRIHQNEPEITGEQAKAILDYCNCEDVKFYCDKNGDIFSLDVSEDYTGEGMKESNFGIAANGIEYADKAKDYAYSIYNEESYNVVKDLWEKEKLFANPAQAQNEKQISFIGDEEKMKDFPKLSKEEFLSSYSYLSEEEYDATAKDYDKLNKSSVPSRFSDTVKTVEDINKVYDRNLDFIEQNISFKYSNPEFNEIDEIEKWKNGELFIPLEDRNGNYTTDMEANTLEEYNSYANKNFKTYSEVIKYQAELKSKLFDSAIENCITEYLRREYAETRPGSGKFEYTVENQSYPIDKEELDYISNTNEWGSADDRLNELIDRRFEEEIEQKEIDIVSDVLEYISQETNGNLVLKNTELNDVLFSDELVQIYAPKEEFLAIQPEETKAALMEAGIARGELYNNVEIVSVSEKARDEMLSANFAGHGGLTQKAFMDNGIEIDLETAKALENCFSQIEAITKYTADGHDLFSKGNGIDTISEHSIEYSEETKSWFIHEKNWLALSAIKGDKADPDDYMEKADRVGDRNWSIGCELLVKYVYQEIKEDGEIEKEFPDTFKKLEHLKDYTESLTEAKQLISDFCFNEYMSTPTFDDLKDVGLAYTTFDDPYTHEEYEIQTSADLINNKITTKVNDKIADSMEYDSLKDMVVNRLNNLDFDSLIYLPSSKLDELLKEERESVENTLLEKADQIIAETFNEPSLAKRAKLYVPSDYGYEGDNKIHILVEFDNNAEREDDLFNALAERHFVLPNGKEVDFNPIKPEKSGTIEQYLDSLERIKENRFQRRKEDKLEKVVVSKENFRDVFNEVIKLPKYKNKPLEAAGFCFSRVPKENKAEVAQWFSNLGCKTKKDTNNLFNKWNKENNPKPDANKSKNNEKDDWSISD